MYVVDATKSCIMSVPYFWFLLVKSTVKIVALTLLKVSSTIYGVNYTVCVVDATKSCIISVPYFWFLLVKSTVKIVALTLLIVSSTIYSFWTTL